MPKPQIRNVIESSASAGIIPEKTEYKQKNAENQRLLKASSILPADQDGGYLFVSGVSFPSRESALKRIEKFQKEQKQCFIGTAAYSRKEEQIQFATRLTGFSLNFNSKVLLDSSQALLLFLPEGVVCPDDKGCVYISWLFDREYKVEDTDTLFKELKEIFSGRATVTPRIPWNSYSRKEKFPGEVSLEQFEMGLGGALNKLMEAKGLKKPANMALKAPESPMRARNDSGDASVRIKGIEGEQCEEAVGLEETAVGVNMETEQEMADTKLEAENDTVRFIEAIWGGKGFVNIRCIGNGPPQNQNFTDAAVAWDYAQRQNASGRNVYVATAAVSDEEPAKGSAAKNKGESEPNFLHARSIPIDFDVVKPGKDVSSGIYETKEASLAGMMRVKDQLFAGMDSPLIVVNSGGGTQAHVILSEEIDAETRRRLGQKVERFAFQIGEKPDKAVTKDIVRVMRVPGTFNRKPEYGEPRSTSIIEWHSAEITPSELESRLDELLGAGEEQASPEGLGAAGTGIDDVTRNLMNYAPVVIAENRGAISSVVDFLIGQGVMDKDYHSWWGVVKDLRGACDVDVCTDDDEQFLYGEARRFSEAWKEWQDNPEEAETDFEAKWADTGITNGRIKNLFTLAQGVGWKNPGADGGGVASAQGGLTDSRWGLEYYAPSDDILHARIFAETAARAYLKYTPRGWMQYNGTVWENKPDGLATEFAKSLVGELREYAKGVSDEDNQKKVLGHVQNLSTKTGLSNMVSLAKSDSRIYEGSVAAFDPDPMKFQSKNGVLDLRTGVLNPNSPDWMTTKASPVEFDALARCPKWLKFLEETFSGDGETIESLQRWLGYSMTGVVRQEHICFWAGKGSNGKSTINRVMAHIWGSYRVQTSAGLLVASPNQDPAKPNPMLVMTVGGRMLAVNEMPKHARLDDYAARQIAGTELVTTRDLNQGAFSFLPSGKITCSLNDMPRAADMSPALWRRVRIIPFKTHIADDKKNFNLADELMEEAAGILNWLIEGCVKWNTDGLIWSGECNDAVEQYKQDTDTLGDFMKRFVITGDNQDRIEQPEVWKMYREHMIDHGEVRVGKKMLFQMIGERQGVDRKPSRGKDWFIGIKLAA